MYASMKYLRSPQCQQLPRAPFKKEMVSQMNSGMCGPIVSLIYSVDSPLVLFVCKFTGSREGVGKALRSP